MAENHLRIRIDAEGKDAERVIGQVRQQLGRLGESAEKSSRKLKDTGNAFSELISKASGLVSVSATLALLYQKSEEYARSTFETRRVFGDMANEIIQKTRDMANAVNHYFTSTEIQYAFRKIHDSLERYGLDIEKQTKLVDRAMDIAAARGLTLSETIDRIESAMRGEAEASEYLGLTLNDTYMKNQALGGSLRELWTTLSDSEKAQYRYLEFLQQSKKYTDAAKEASVSLGQELKSAFNEIIEEVGPEIEWLNHALAELLHNLRQASKEAAKEAASQFSLEGGTMLNPGISAQDIDQQNAFIAQQIGPILSPWKSVEKEAARFVQEVRNANSQVKNATVATSQEILKVDQWLSQQRIALIQDETARKIAAIRAEEKKILGLVKNNAALKEKIEAVTERKIAQIRQQALEEEIRETKRQKEAILDSYEAAKAFIEVHSQSDSVAMAIERIKQQYDSLEESIWNAFEAGVIGADEAWNAMEKLDRAMNNDIARVKKVPPAHIKAAQEVSEAWKNAYNNITNALADALTQGGNLLERFVNWAKQLLAQLLAKEVVATVAAGMGLPGAAAWAGQGMSLGGVGSSASSIWNAISQGGGILNTLSGGLTNAGNILMNAPSKLWGFLFGGTAAQDYTGYGIAMASESELFNGMPSWLTGASGAGLTAGLGTFLLSGLLGGDWAKAAVSGATTGLGAWGGATLAPLLGATGPIGAIIGAIGGGLLGNIFGGLFGDGTERTYLDQDLFLRYKQRPELKTVRWDRGEPDWMDVLVKSDQELADKFSKGMDSFVEQLDKVAPGFADLISKNTYTMRFQRGVETEDEYKERIKLATKTFYQDIIGTIGKQFTSYAPDFIKKQFQSPEIQGLLDIVGKVNPQAVEDFNSALASTLDQFKTLPEITDEDSLKQWVSQVDEAMKGFQGLVAGLRELNKQIIETEQSIFGSLQDYGNMFKDYLQGKLSKEEFKEGVKDKLIGNAQDYLATSLSNVFQGQIMEPIMRSMLTDVMGMVSMDTNGFKGMGFEQFLEAVSAKYQEISANLGEYINQKWQELTFDPQKAIADAANNLGLAGTELAKNVIDSGQTFAGAVHAAADSLMVVANQAGSAAAQAIAAAQAANSAAQAAKNVVNIPKLARGGIVTRPTIAMIGEAGPEAVVPLKDKGSFFDNDDLAGLLIDVVRHTQKTADMLEKWDAVGKTVDTI